jgi:hypothetical protein
MPVSAGNEMTDPASSILLIIRILKEFAKGGQAATMSGP